MAGGNGQAEQIRHEPYDIEVEQALLGACIAENKNIDLVAAELTADHFHDPLHQRIYETMLALSVEGEFNPLELHAMLKSDPGLIECGGLAYLAGLVQASPSYPNVTGYSQIVRDLAQRRELIAVGKDIIEACYSSPSEASSRAIADRAGDALIRVGSDHSKEIVTPFEAAMESVREMELMKANKLPPGVPAHLSKLAKEIRVYRGGDFVLVPAKPGMGKSAFMTGVSMRAALAGYPVKIFSLEMTLRENAERMVTDLDFDDGHKPMWYSRVRSGQLSDDEFARFMLTARQLEHLPLSIDDEDGLTMQQIGARSRAFMAKFKGQIGLIVIDYLQIVTPADLRLPREQQVASIARAMKRLAKQTGWVVMAGCQMNDDDAKRSKDEQRPRAGDVRESKVLEQEADLMLSPWRAAVPLLNRKPMEGKRGDADWEAWAAQYRDAEHKMELLCLKNRHGRRFDLKLFCDMGANAIRDRDPKDHSDPPEVEQAQLELLEGPSQ